MTPTRPGGLAPLSASGAVVVDLPPIADELVMAHMRRAIAEEGARGNIPGQRALERVLPLVAEGVAALLRIRIDGLADIAVEPRRGP